MTKNSTVWLIIKMIFFVFTAISAQAQSCHGGGNLGGGGSGPNSGAMLPQGVGALQMGGSYNDTCRTRVIVYGYLSNSLSRDGHQGDPLGTGGKIPLLYNAELYMESALDQPSLAKRDLRVAYQDFGYIPIWRSNTIFTHMNLRLNPELYANLGLYYGGDPGEPGTNQSSGGWGISDATLSWSPAALKGWTLKAGNILDAGTYSGIFNQSPMENFLFSGLMLSYRVPIGDLVRVDVDIAGGGTFQNVTIQQEEASPTYHDGYLRSTRERTYLYGKARVQIADHFAIKVLGGVQHLPLDSAQIKGGKGWQKYEENTGYHVGAAFDLDFSRFSQTLVFTWGYGDVVMGWGTPDYVRSERIDSLRSNSYPPKVISFTKRGSELTNLIYWGTLSLGRVSVEGGAWAMLRNPAARAQTVPDQNNTWDSTRNSSLRAAGILQEDTITIKPQPFKAVKFALFPQVRLWGPLRIGVRYDRIEYLTPSAHTNGQELSRDAALRPRKYPGITGSVYTESPWEREPVDVHLLSPTLALDFAGLGSITFTYSKAWYGNEVIRHGGISDQHDNVTLSTNWNYAFR